MGHKDFLGHSTKPRHPDTMDKTRVDYWVNHYRKEGAELAAGVKQFDNRVKAWMPLSHPTKDQDVGQAKVDRLKAGAAYNFFVSHQGEAIQKELAHHEKELKKAITPANRAHWANAVKTSKAELAGWQQVVSDPKLGHKPVPLEPASYKGNLYSPPDASTHWRTPKFSRDTNTTRGTVNHITDPAATHIAGISPEAKQAACIIGANGLFDALAPGFSGSGIVTAPLGQMEGAVRGVGPTNACKETFPTNDWDSFNTRRIDPLQPTSRQAQNTAIFEQLITAMDSGDSTQQRLAQLTAFNSDSAQEMFGQARETVDVHEREQAHLTHSQNEQHVALAQATQSHGRHR